MAAGAGCSLGRRLGLCGKSHPLGTEGGVALWAGRRSFFFVFARSSIIFLLFGLFLLPGGLLLGLGAGWGCFIGFLIENIFLEDLRGIRRDQKQHEGQRRAPQSDDLALCHHPHKLKDLLPTGDEARAEHVVDAEGLARRGGRRGGVVHNVRELLLQLQIVQNEAVAVVGYAEAVRGLAVGGSSEVGADPGGQPGVAAAIC